jgi:MoxR-like ATPase
MTAYPNFHKKYKYTSLNAAAGDRLMRSPDIKALTTTSEGYSAVVEKAVREIGKRVVGQDEVIEKMMIALLSEGHVLLEGVPGLAKTLMIRTLADTLKLEFKRIQFTPDLLPADIIGTRIYDHRSGSFSTKLGPVFANFILADEINRAPPKVQSALLEAMQEKQVTIGDESHKLELPFLVLATQNPLETEGTYVLPEAQVDRFMLKILIGYPTKEEEHEIVRRNTENKDSPIAKILSQKELREMQAFVKDIYADDKVVSYVTEIVDATRHPERHGLDIKPYIDCGASPRASIWLIMGGKARALLNRRGYVIPEDMKYIAHEVLRHRIIVSYEAEAEGIDSDAIIDKILSAVRVP